MPSTPTRRRPTTSAAGGEPARRDAKREVIRARAELARAEQTEGRANLDGMQTDTTVRAAFEEARAEVVRLEERARALPAKVPLGEVRPQAARAEVERKRIHDAARMATYNAESALARMLTPALRPGRGRGPQPAAGDIPCLGRSRGRRQRTARAHRTALGRAAIPCVGGTLSGADGDRDALPRDRSAPRLLGEDAVSLQRFWPHVRSCGIAPQHQAGQPGSRSIPAPRSRLATCRERSQRAQRPGAEPASEIARRRRTRHRGADGRCDDADGVQARRGRDSAHDADGCCQPECGFVVNAVFLTTG